MAEIYEHEESLAEGESDVLAPLAQYSSLRRISIPRSTKFSRSDVVSAFASAFEMIGGTARLALWANENPTEFFRLFGKLLPSATQTEVMMHPALQDVRYLTTEELLTRLGELREPEHTLN